MGSYFAFNKNIGETMVNKEKYIQNMKKTFTEQSSYDKFVIHVYNTFKNLESIDV